MSTFNYLQEALREGDGGAENVRVGIVYTEWNAEMVGTMLAEAVKMLRRAGVPEENIRTEQVPGSMELVYGSAALVRSGLVDVVIALGVVIRGDTPHFDYICQGATQGLTHLNATQSVPVVFGVLTVENEAQAWERARGENGGKGAEFALTALKMANFSWKFRI